MSAVVEIRTYKLRPGSGAEFHRTVVDDDSYYLIRSYPSLEERQRSQDAFYGSDEWRHGPREAIVSRIEGDSIVLLPAGLLLPPRDSHAGHS